MHRPAPLVAEVNKAGIQLSGIMVISVGAQVGRELSNMGFAVGPDPGNNSLLEPGDHVAQQEVLQAGVPQGQAE
eukprot:7892422-Prorocentrum_lima.AAC.1